MKLGFKKLDERAVIPSKRKEDAGYDVYGVFDDDEVFIRPGEIVKVGCKIASIIPFGHGVILKERSSLGSKGVAVRAGVIDYGYRGEWIVCLNNTSNKTVILSSNVQDTLDRMATSRSFNNDNTVVYPMDKAICQAVLIKIPDEVEVVEVDDEEFAKHVSVRGEGAFGSTGK